MAEMGKLIVLDGLDGSGKATHTRLLCQAFKEEGLNIKQVSFPDYESPASAPVRLYLSGVYGDKAADVNPYAASTFYAVDRYSSFKTKWKKAYLGGTHIFADRYTTSNAIHQMSKLKESEWDGFLDWLYDFEYNKLGLPRPDKVLYLDMLPEISQNLINRRYRGDISKKDIHERDKGFLEHCRESALYAAERLGWEVVKLYNDNGPLSKQDNFTNIYSMVRPLF